MTIEWTSDMLNEYGINGPIDARIDDDGTLDFCVSYTCPDCMKRVNLRYDNEMRKIADDMGLHPFITDEWLAMDGQECDCANEEV